MHVGLIPDGNRRWCAKNGETTQGLIRHHVANALLALCKLRKLWDDDVMHSVRDIHTVSAYMLSYDNLTKRSDSTIEMVTRVMTLFFVVVYALHIADVDPDRREAHVDMTKVAFLVTSCELEAIVPPSNADIDALLDAMGPSYHGGGAFEVDPDLDADLQGILPPAWRRAYRYAAANVVAAAAAAAADPNPFRVLRKEEGSSSSSSSTFRFVDAVSIEFIGELEALPSGMRALTRAIEGVMSLSSNKDIKKRFKLRIAVAYDPVEDMRRRPESDCPIDLVIRTSGVQRSSGFFPSDTLYSEWMYPACLFPDLTLETVLDCLARFEGAQRRYGA
jgi:undecaprenyl pyrophosphate synthase